jgi:hypothetical protein
VYYYPALLKQEEILTIERVYGGPLQPIAKELRNLPEWLCYKVQYSNDTRVYWEPANKIVLCVNGVQLLDAYKDSRSKPMIVFNLLLL